MATREQREQNTLYSVQMKPHTGLTFLTARSFIAVSSASKEKDSVWGAGGSRHVLFNGYAY